MALYEVEVEFTRTFTGNMVVEAENEEQARDYITNQIEAGDQLADWARLRTEDGDVAFGRYEPTWQQLSCDVALMTLRPKELEYRVGVRVSAEYTVEVTASGEEEAQRLAEGVEFNITPDYDSEISNVEEDSSVEVEIIGVDVI